MCCFNRLRTKKARTKFIKWAINGILICLLIILFTNFSHAETDVTEKIVMINSRLMYDRLNKVSYLDVGLKNISQDVLLTPIKVVIDNISPSAVTVANADGITDNGKPYFKYDYPLLEKGQLDPEETSPVKRFKFNNPNRQRFSYTTKILGPLVPTGMPTPEETLSCAANAIEDGDIEEALKMYSANAHNKKRDLLNLLDSTERERLAESLKNAIWDEEFDKKVNEEVEMIGGEGSGNIKTYKTETFVGWFNGGSLVAGHLHVQKLSSGNWVIMD